MSIALKVLLRVVRRRMEQGETLDCIMESFPRLTGKEREELRKALAI